MRYLFISDDYPEFDRNSADFRLSQLMEAIRVHGPTDFWAIGPERQTARIGAEETQRYQAHLATRGLEVVHGGLRRILRTRAYDAVFLEWYYSAAPFIQTIRALAPQARVVTDSVDVVFNRLRAKARVSGNPQDAAHAVQTQLDELRTYRNSDLVLTVSDQDADILREHDAGLRMFTVPNIHPLHDCVPQVADAPKVMVFVGSRSDANDDAMRYFCLDVLPRILAEEPAARLRVVGTVTVPALEASVASAVEVLGFVPDTRPPLESSLVSVAPLRFGGGMKGKVGEAMSLGLVVVASTIGAEGFGLTSGREALIADDPAEFARAVVSLLRDPAHRERVRRAGWQFIRDQYSTVAVQRRVAALVQVLESTLPQRLPAVHRLALGAHGWWTDHVAWRLR
ncbi:MAG: glycosyltransferase [Gammaproteobacteria bacterium]